MEPIIFTENFENSFQSFSKKGAKRRKGIRRASVVVVKKKNTTVTSPTSIFSFVVFSVHSICSKSSVIWKRRFALMQVLELQEESEQKFENKGVCQEIISLEAQEKEVEAILIVYWL